MARTAAPIAVAATAAVAFASTFSAATISPVIVRRAPARSSGDDGLFIPNLLG
jgi:hypothetical protein